MKIGIDARGGDHAPKAIIDAVLRRAGEVDYEFILYGRESDFYNVEKNNIVKVICQDEILDDDKPAIAIRRKKESSMVRGLMDLKESRIDGFLSAGNTGALLMGGMFVVGRIKGIKRPALTTAFPTIDGFCVVSDAGANADCEPEFLLRFAQMSSIYAQQVLGIENPKVALVNVGVEETKGNELALASHQLLATSIPNFIGNIEGRDIILGGADVVVCDGFTGNIILKTTEGTAKFFTTKLKEALLKNTVTKLSALGLKKPLTELKKAMDYREYGGAPLLGVKAPLVKAHGSSDERAFYSAIKYLESYISSTVIQEIGANHAQD